jgi:hypothetical protein
VQRVQCVAAFVAFVVCADLHVLSSTKRQVGAGEIMWDRIGAVEDSRSRLCWPWFRLSYGFKQSHQNPFIPSCILILSYSSLYYYYLLLFSVYIYIFYSFRTFLGKWLTMRTSHQSFLRWYQCFRFWIEAAGSNLCFDLKSCVAIKQLRKVVEQFHFVFRWWSG